MAQIKRFSNAIELTAKGTEEKIRVDFTDKRIVNKLLRLIKKYKNIDEYVAEKMKGVEEIVDSTVEYIKEMGIDIQDKSELNDENIEKFIVKDSDKPIFFEVFTDKYKNMEQMSSLIKANENLSAKDKVKRVVKSIIRR